MNHIRCCMLPNDPVHSILMPTSNFVKSLLIRIYIYTVRDYSRRFCVNYAYPHICILEILSRKKIIYIFEQLPSLKYS